MNIKNFDTKSTIVLNGETLEVECNYRTIYNYEKETSRSITSILKDNVTPTVSDAVEFIFAAIRNKNKKYTRDYILENFDRKLFIQVISEVIPKTLINAFSIEDDKTEDSSTSSSEEDSEKKIA